VSGLQPADIFVRGNKMIWLTVVLH